MLSNAQHVKTPNMRSKLPIFLNHEKGNFWTFLFSFVAHISNKRSIGFIWFLFIYTSCVFYLSVDRHPNVIGNVVFTYIQDVIQRVRPVRRSRGPVSILEFRFNKTYKLPLFPDAIENNMIGYFCYLTLLKMTENMTNNRLQSVMTMT